MRQIALGAYSGSRFSVYYGWWVLAAGALMEMLAIGSTSYAAGLFVLPLQDEFSLSRAAASSVLPILFAGAALMAPLVGYLLDRFPVQWIIGGGAVAFGAGLMAISTLSSLPLMALILLIPVAFGGMAIGPLTTSTLTSRWFFRRRGRALGIATVATSAGGIVVVPLLSWGIQAYGWRTALLVEAMLIVLLVLTIAAFVIRSGPAVLSLGSHPENQGRPTADMRLASRVALASTERYGSILRALNFWAIGFVLAAISGIEQAIVVTVVPYGSELGFSPASAAFLISAFSVSAAIVKLASGYLAEFIDRRTILFAATLAMNASLLCLLVSSSYVSLLLACCLAGMALGCVLPSSAALVATCFGSPAFGRVMGMIYVGIVVASVVSVQFTGRVYDSTGSYRVAFECFLAISMLCAVAALLVRAPQSVRADRSQAADLSATDAENIVASGSPR